jgi:acetate kinase
MAESPLHIWAQGQAWWAMSNRKSVAATPMHATGVTQQLYHDCGLYGFSEISDNMQILEASNDLHATKAINLFVYRINRELGSLTVALGEINELVFTAALGEHSAEIRRRVYKAMAWLGIEIDKQAQINGDFCLSPAKSKVSA